MTRPESSRQHPERYYDDEGEAYEPDDGFQERLAASMERHKRILDRLADQ